jgi:D-alanyl-lipoteichoic acid acyltransferase DltB (MBOAT superfamily)
MTYVNLTITMFLGGLWHGAAWNFAWWGLYHGALLTGHRFLSGFSKISINKLVSIFIMYQFTLFGWMLFRCSLFGIENGTWVDHSGQQIILFFHALTRMPLITSAAISMAATIAAFSAPLIAIEYYQIRMKNIYILLKLPRPVFSLILGILIFGLVRFGVQTGGAFIYFQF